jgi:hypothetical protein
LGRRITDLAEKLVKGKKRILIYGVKPGMTNVEPYAR